MATLSEQEIKQLADRLADRWLAVMGVNSSRKSSYSKPNVDTDEGLEKVKNTIENNSSAFTNATKTFIKNLQGVGDIYKALDLQTRSQSKNVRALNDALTDFIKTSKNAVDGLEKLKSMSDNLKKSMDTYKSNLDSFKDSKKTVDSLAKAQKEHADKLAKATASLNDPKNKNRPRTQRQIDSLTIKIDALGKSLKEADEIYMANKKAMLDNYKAIEEYSKTTNALNQHQLDYLKNFEDLDTESEEYLGTVIKLNESAKHFDDGLNTVADVLIERSKQMDQALGKFGDNLGKAGMALLTKGPQVAWKDLMNQLKYNVNQHDYTTSALMGMSEAERDQTIGENRTGLRLLGNGNEDQGLKTGGKDIQKAAWQYGVIGQDAIKLGLQYQQSMIASGYGGNAKDTADQMTVMHNFSKQLGVTDDALKDYTDSLIKNGEMNQLNNENANLDVNKQREAVNKEIMARLALNKQLGISLDRQKEMDEETMSAKYGGVQKAVMAGVGANLEIRQYNQDNPNSKLTKGEQTAYLQGNQRGPDSLKTDQERKDYETARQKISGNRSAQLDKASQQGEAQFEAAEAKYVTAYSPFISDMQKRDTEANQEAATRKSYGNTPVVTNQSYDQLQKNVIDSTNSLIPFNKAVIDATQTLKGLGKNPAGEAAGGVGSALLGLGKDVLAQMIAGKITGSLKGGVGKLLGRGAGTAAEEGAAGLAEGGAAEVGGGALATGAAGTVALGAAAVTAAGAIGYGIGTVINKTLLEGTKTGDAIGSGLTKMMAFFGSDSAKEAIKNNKDAADKDAATDKRMDQINAVTQAEKAAVQARGTPQAQAAQAKAEQLRQAYYGQYHVDLSGKSVGYQGTPLGKGLTDLTKSDATKAADAQQAANTSQDQQAAKLDKLISIMQQQLDILRKQDQEMDQDLKSDNGKATLELWKEHVAVVRQGLASKPA